MIYEKCLAFVPFPLAKAKKIVHTSNRSPVVNVKWIFYDGLDLYLFSCMLRSYIKIYQVGCFLSHHFEDLAFDFFLPLAEVKKMLSKIAKNEKCEWFQKEPLSGKEWEMNNVDYVWNCLYCDDEIAPNKYRWKIALAIRAFHILFNRKKRHHFKYRAIKAKLPFIDICRSTAIRIHDPSIYLSSSRNFALLSDFLTRKRCTAKAKWKLNKSKPMV